jgi:alpha-tubulin suppressor-like RCC1 family protein
MTAFARTVCAPALVVAMVAVAALASTSPVSAAALSDITGLTAGQNHACARLANGQARCWGDNLYGQLGDGTNDDRGSAVPVKGPAGTARLRGVARIVAGPQDTCAVLTSGQVRCWGANYGGQLGDGTKVDRSRPVTVLNASGTRPLKQVRAIAPGDSHTCALLTSGKVRCWGANDDGQLGDGTNDEHLRPVLVKDPTGSGPLRDVVALDSGLAHTCARLSSGQARCWGADNNGELGDGEPKDDSVLPVVVRSVGGPGKLKHLAGIDLGEDHSCAELMTGQARCWGYNGNGEAGDGTTGNDRPRPVIVKAPSGIGPLVDIADIAIGGSHGCARLPSRRALCWGDNDDGQLGNGTPSDGSGLPVPVRNAGGGRLSKIAQLAVGYGFTCARLRSGRAQCWGRNGDGQLGDGTFAESHVPVTVIW